MLDVESYDYVRNEGDGLGFKIALSHPHDMPSIQGNGVGIKPGHLTPYIPYEDGYHYSISNCLFIATVQAAETTCNCTPGFIEIEGNNCVGKGLKCFKDIFQNLGKYFCLNKKIV